jgi:N6-L-threonylcarbamoyladenine synthase
VVESQVFWVRSVTGLEIARLVAFNKRGGMSPFDFRTTDGERFPRHGLNAFVCHSLRYEMAGASRLALSAAKRMSFLSAGQLASSRRRGRSIYERSWDGFTQAVLRVRSRHEQLSNSCATSWTCSASRRRKNVGLPKGILGDHQQAPALTAETSPWEDYILPELEGNSKLHDRERFACPTRRPFVVLGVESSCDDTAAAVVRSDGTVLGEHTVSQSQLTEIWGGVVPHVARDAHAEAIERVMDSALRDAGMKPSDIDAVGVTMGPGLEICLRVGYRACRAFAIAHEKPFVAVNHLEAHILMPRCFDSSVQFPFLTLLVSGGHCQLLLTRDVAKYEVIGGTLDDALGEAFDKTARLLGLDVGGGGGPALEVLAREGDPTSIPFPVPMRKRRDCNFSFAGLKTSVRTAIERSGGTAAVCSNDILRANIAASFQETAVRHLEDRTRRAMQICDQLGTGGKTLVVAGGVAANAVVRARLGDLCAREGWRVAIPSPRLCTDNGIMVAWAAVERLSRGIADDYNRLDVRARWPLAKLGDFGLPIPAENNLQQNVKV